MSVIKVLEDLYGKILSEESKIKLEKAFNVVNYKKDEILLQQGEICTKFILIKKGIIRLFYYKDGRDITEHFSTEYEFVFAIESLFCKKPTELMIEALEDSEVYEIAYDELLRLCSTATDISKLYQRILEFDLVISQKKADSWRFESSRERYERFSAEYPEVVRRASIAHIATYLLMTPETLSRVRAGTL